MLYTDRNQDGISFAKDPCVVWYQGKTFLYYSAYGLDSIGIAVSDDYEHWTKVGSIPAEQEAEGKGICAPAAIVLDGVLHLFFQSYGQFPRDFICHATSLDGVHFTHDPSNPVIRPVGDWNNGRAIDADVIVFQNRLLCYWATRDPEGRVQMLGVSGAPLNSGFGRDSWTQLCDASILRPELPWEMECIEAPAAIVKENTVYLFYAGAYNCSPQQISCAVSEDGVHFRRISEQPLLTNGPQGSWNASESGHPYVFEGPDGTIRLFYQGSPDGGTNWMLSSTTVCRLERNAVELEQKE